jgi:hypothetical protein
MSITKLSILGLAVGLCGVAGPASALSKYQTTLIPLQAGTKPGFSASGSSIKLDGHRKLLVKIKNVVDGTGARVTTDPNNASDNYSVEIDVDIPATAATGTVTVSFDLKNGNGGASADVSTNVVFTGATTGDGVGIDAVRVKDGSGTVIGRGGVAIE